MIYMAVITIEMGEVPHSDASSYFLQQLSFGPFLDVVYFVLICKIKVFY
jgi:hypothetical protein